MKYCSLILFFITSLFSAASFCEPENLDVVKQQLIKYHDTGAYMHEFSEQAQLVKKYLEQRVKQNQQQIHPRKLALVLDIDETVLSNYVYLLQNSFGGTRKNMNKFMKEYLDPALVPMRDVYNYAKQHQISIFFITGRPAYLRDCTEENLRRVGITGWTALYLKPLDYKNKSNMPYKSAIRKQIVAQGYDVIATVGDQLSDLSGGSADKGFKLPNPYYFIQ